MSYDFKNIEQKWQKYWDENKTFATGTDYSKEKWFGLVEFPYPSGQGLHVGHPRSYTALDVIARKRRMQGYNVLYPIGFDAFGLPAENFAMKNHVHPKITTEKNVANFTRQLKSIGFSFDWDRAVNTTDPNYYKWTQWIFVQMFKKGLAYKTTMPINFCTGCKVGLANEEVVNGVCERCGSPVVQKEKSQWMLKITEYAQRLIDDLDEVDYLPQIKTQQRNWIGRSEGAEVKFSLSGSDKKLTVYTTRPDTLFGATYMVIAPEHPIIKELSSQITNIDEIENYKTQASLKSDFERAELNKEKTGVEIKGIKAINPVTGKEIPIWVSDYVLITYGTGAIMAVPAHDTRDYEFAQKFGLNIIPVLEGGDVSKQAFTGDGIHINSDFLNGMNKQDAINAMISWLEEKQIGSKKVNYKLRDWVFSRQRYWGEPIPMVYCDCCGWVPVPEEQLPVTLPDIQDYEPGENGESPLSKLTNWVNTTCPHCGKPAKRETDTMPQWAGSSCYYLRYTDPHNDKELASKEALNYWTPVNWYNGGMEHTTLHLLYSRFWHKFLYDIGVVPTKEPYGKRTSHGMILGSNGEKMSKSKGNVVNPDDVIAEFGADTLRVYEMFMGPFDQTASWSVESIRGCAKFLDRVWNLQEFVTDGDTYSEQFEKLMHKSIKKVSQDIEEMKFNTCISTFMTMVNEFYKYKKVNKAELSTLVQMLSLFAPHICEEMWEKVLGHTTTISYEKWPEFDDDKTIDDEIEIPVQFNGKLKANVHVPLDSDEQTVKSAVHSNEKVISGLEGKTIIKEIYVKNRIYNIVVK